MRYLDSEDTSKTASQTTQSRRKLHKFVWGEASTAIIARNRVRSLTEFGASLRTPALKTENFSKKNCRFGNRENGFPKRLLSLFLQCFCPGDGFSKSIFAFY